MTAQNRFLESHIGHLSSIRLWVGFASLTCMCLRFVSILTTSPSIYTWLCKKITQMVWYEGHTCVFLHHYVSLCHLLAKKSSWKTWALLCWRQPVTREEEFSSCLRAEGVDFQSQCHPQLTKSFVLFHEFALDLWKIQQYNVYLTGNLLKWWDRWMTFFLAPG